MPSRTVFCLMFLFFVGGLVFPAHSASPLFTIQDVHVDVTAEDAIKARDKAFAQAQAIAFSRLAKRMLPDSEQETFEQPEINIISTLIKDFEITQEKLSHVRYIATYTFRFEEGAVQDYFSGSGVEYTDVGSKPVLILPFYQYQSQTILWSPYNSWMQAWRKPEDLEGIVPIVVPLGDLEDVKDIGEDEALTYDEKGLTSMLNRYKAGEAVLVIAIPDRELSQVAKDKDEAAGALNVHIYRTDRSGPEFVNQFVVSARSGQNRAELFADAVEKAQQQLQKNWKDKTLVRAGDSNRLQVRVTFNTLQEWTETQRALERVYGINEIELKSLSPQSARVDLLFQGSERRLRLALSQADIVLTQPRISVPSFGQGHDNPGLPLVYELYLNRFQPAAGQPASRTF